VRQTLGPRFQQKLPRAPVASADKPENSSNKQHFGCEGQENRKQQNGKQIQSTECQFHDHRTFIKLTLL